VQASSLFARQYLAVKKYLPTFILFALAAIAFQPLAANAQPTVTDARTGCKIKMISVGDSPPRVSWDGACVGGFASGVGTVVLDPGVRYTGEMRDGWRNGQGKITFPSGNTYEGGFVNSQFSGRGLYIFPDGQRVEGQFRDGNANGPCEITSATRVRLSGQCVDGELEGQGTMQYPDGGRYDGGFAKSLSSGQGVYIGPKRQFRQVGFFKEGRLFSGRAYLADDSYQNIENGKPVGEMVVSAATQATLLLNALVSAAGNQNSNVPPGSNSNQRQQDSASSTKKSYREPQTGRDCVTKVGSTREGDKYIRVKFQNICDGKFSYLIKLPNGGGTRGTGIGPGTPGRPETSSVVCGVNDQCESAPWSYN